MSYKMPVDKKFTELDYTTNVMLRTVEAIYYIDAATLIYKHFYKHCKFKVIKLQYLDSRKSSRRAKIKKPEVLLEEKSEIKKPEVLSEEKSENTTENTIGKIPRTTTNTVICYHDYYNEIQYYDLTGSDEVQEWIISCFYDNPIQTPTSGIGPDLCIQLMDIATEICTDNTLMSLNKIQWPTDYARTVDEINLFPLLDLKKFDILEQINNSGYIKFHFKIQDFYRILKLNDHAQINWLHTHWIQDIEAHEIICCNISLNDSDIDPILYLLTTACMDNDMVVLENFTKICYFYCNSLYLYIPLYYNNIAIFKWLLSYFDNIKSGIFVHFNNIDFNTIKESCMDKLYIWQNNTDTRLSNIIYYTQFSIKTSKKV
jgi:hypothetical protein